MTIQERANATRLRLQNKYKECPSCGQFKKTYEFISRKGRWSGRMMNECRACKNAASEKEIKSTKLDFDFQLFKVYGAWGSTVDVNSTSVNPL